MKDFCPIFSREILENKEESKEEDVSKRGIHHCGQNYYKKSSLQKNIF